MQLSTWMLRQGNSVIAPIVVIVAEDNEINRTFMVKVIEKLGYKVIPVEDGRQALEMAQTTNAEIVVTDYDMPNMNGIELARSLRQLNLDHYIHVILVTGSTDERTRLACLEAGVDDFLSKGRGTSGLQARLRVATRLIEHERELAKQHRLIKEVNERIRVELEKAADGQRQLLPELENEILGVRIASAFVPSAEVSGDMFGCFALDKQHIGFYAADVSGHGVSASLLSVGIGHVITQNYFAGMVLGQRASDHMSFLGRNDARQVRYDRSTGGADPERAPNPAALIADLNQRFSRWDNDDYFTMFCGVLDTWSCRLHYCQAGYPSPVYVAQSGEAEMIGDGGFPVGMFPDVTFESNTTELDKGGALVIFSDAALEAENAQREAFGTERLRQAVQRNRLAGIDNLPDLLIDSLSEWRDSRTLEDDLTILAMEIRNTDDLY